jgi:hypothetical protein
LIAAFTAWLSVIPLCIICLATAVNKRNASEICVVSGSQDWMMAD